MAKEGWIRKEQQCGHPEQTSHPNESEPEAIGDEQPGPNRAGEGTDEPTDEEAVSSPGLGPVPEGRKANEHPRLPKLHAAESPTMII